MRGAVRGPCPAPFRPAPAAELARRAAHLRRAVVLAGRWMTRAPAAACALVTSAYGPVWPRIRRAYLYANPWCVLCGQAANVADHFPLSRRELIARGERNPDAAKHLRPLCAKCHNGETARNQPGGFAAEARSRREANERPPF
ncbi:HNH endonuclease [Streptomyces sp. SirexAA-E]|nr:HNH endonuclease [Streptomyces sp. SirexAA-E]